MYIQELTDKQYNTLEFVKGKPNAELPNFDWVVQKVCNESLEEEVKAPATSLRNKQFFLLDKKGILELRLTYGSITKHKVLSLLAVAAAVTIAVAALAVTIMFCPAVAAAVFLAGVIFVVGTGVYPANVFDISKRLNRSVLLTQSLEQDVIVLAKFMDTHGNRLLEKFERDLQELKPQTDEELNQKQQIECAALQLRLAAKFVADYSAQMEDKVEE